MTRINLKILNKNFTYKKDTKDRWKIKDFSTPNTGDCEDYALGYIRLNEGSWWETYKAIIKGDYELYTCNTNQGSHLILYDCYYDRFIDNIQKDFFEKSSLTQLGYYDVKRLSRLTITAELLLGLVGV